MRVGSGWLGGGNGDWAIGATCVRRAVDGAAEDGGPDDMDDEGVGRRGYGDEVTAAGMGMATRR